jgi:hypothetical protein
MRFVFNLLNFLTFFLVTAVILNSPLILLGFLLRRRVGRGIIRTLLALGFASSPAYWLWRMEWFDVWRHGVPPISYLFGYLPYVIGFGVVGWFVGRLIVPPVRVPGRTSL